MVIRFKWALNRPRKSHTIACFTLYCCGFKPHALACLILEFGLNSPILACKYINLYYGLKSYVFIPLSWQLALNINYTPAILFFQLWCYNYGGQRLYCLY
jgi:hypothetical protein